MNRRAVLIASSGSTTISSILKVKKDADDRWVLLEGNVQYSSQLQKDADDRLRAVGILTDEIGRLNDLLRQAQEDSLALRSATSPTS
jgi:hypothetical protein